jgi:hypothetical protein
MSYSNRQAVLVGLLLGAVFLSRMDGALIAIGFGIAFLLRYNTHISYKNWSDKLRPLITITLVTFLCSIPWFLYSLLVVGRITPVSSDGITFEALQVAPVPVLELMYKVVLWFAGGFVQTIVIFPERTFIGYLAIAIISLMTISYSIITHNDLRTRFVTLLDFLLIAALIYYPFYIFRQLRIRWYYLLFTSFLTALVIATVIARLVENIDRQNVKRLASIGISILLLSNLLIGGFQLYGAEGNLSTKEEVGQYLEENISEEENIAAIGGGGYQYYDERHDILMLAPVINPESLRAWKAGEIESYLVKNNVSYIINHRDGIDVLEKDIENHELETIRSWNGSGGFEPTLVRLNRTNK